VPAPLAPQLFVQPPHLLLSVIAAAELLVALGMKQVVSKAAVDDSRLLVLSVQLDASSV